MIELFTLEGKLKARVKLLFDLQEERSAEEYLIWKETHDETLTQDVVVGQDIDGNDIVESQPVNVFVPTTVTDDELQVYLEDRKDYIKYMRNNMTVTTSTGKTFNADLLARVNMIVAYLGSQVTGITEAPWKLADDSIQIVTIDEIKEANILALQQFGEISKIGVVQ